jgi:hypothetical protein
MLRKDLLIHKTKMMLDEFLFPMLGQLDKPRQRFLRQTVPPKVWLSQGYTFFRLSGGYGTVQMGQG